MPYRLATPLNYLSIHIRCNRATDIYFNKGNNMGWVKGLEPSTLGTTIRCSNQLSYTHHILISQRKLARQEGLEPTAYCLEGSCSIQLSYWRIFHLPGLLRVERVMGIEPTFSAWKADILPLNYTRRFPALN